MRLAPLLSLPLGALYRPRTEVASVEVVAARIGAAFGQQLDMSRSVHHRRCVDFDVHDVRAAFSAHKIHAPQLSRVRMQGPPDA